MLSKCTYSILDTVLSTGNFFKKEIQVFILKELMIWGRRESKRDAHSKL